MSDKPEKIELTAAKVQELQAKIRASNLVSEDQKLLIGLISWCLWLQVKLANSKITISKLKSIFGIKSTEKKSLMKPSQKMTN
jgi:hypothetical protein